MRRVVGTAWLMEHFDISRSTACRWGGEGRFSAEKIGNRWAFDYQEALKEWLVVICGREPSPTPVGDLRELYKLVSELSKGEMFSVEIEETQQRVLELMLGLLPTNFFTLVRNLMDALRGNDHFAFLRLVPDRIPIY